jgi:hypothetical protein
MAGEGPEQDYTDPRVKYLELVQDVIARMSGNSATIKRSSLVVAAAAISVSTALGKPLILLFTAALILVFAFLDARYLRIERCYRDLYDEIRNEAPTRRPDFRLKPPATSAAAHPVAGLMISWSVAGLYLSTVLFMLVLTGIMWK